VAAASTTRIVTVYKNGTELDSGRARRTSINAALIEGAELGMALDLAAGDYIEFYVWHDKGSSLSFGGGSAGQRMSAGLMRLDSGASKAISVADAQVGADVGIGGSAYTDVVSLVLPDGTWDVFAYAAVQNGAGGTATLYAQIATSGNVQLAQSPATAPASGGLTIPILAPSVAGGQTIKLRVFSTQSGNAQGTTSIGSPGGGSKVHAIKVA
jgi:hypothetical protein